MTALRLALHQHPERSVQSVACACSLKVETELNVSARMDSWAELVPKSARRPIMAAYAVVMANAEHTVTLLCVSATRTILGAPAPKAAPKMLPAQFVMAMANVFSRII